jgi:DNA-binding MarR family transcriptional regulator
MTLAAADPQELVELADRLRPTVLRLSRKLRQEGSKAGVSTLDAMILGRIKAKPGLGVCDLADEEQISRPAMSGHVKRLEASGWIRRTEDAEDGRRSGLVVTPAGEKRIDAIRRRRNDWLVDRLARLSPEAQEELAAASATLLQLMALDP